MCEIGSELSELNEMKCVKWNEMCEMCEIGSELSELNGSELNSAIAKNKVNLTLPHYALSVLHVMQWLHLK